jgi:hypothetical protein
VPAPQLNSCIQSSSIDPNGKLQRYIHGHSYTAHHTLLMRQSNIFDAASAKIQTITRLQSCGVTAFALILAATALVIVAALGRML